MISVWPSCYICLVNRRAKLHDWVDVSKNRQHKKKRKGESICQIRLAMSEQERNRMVGKTHTNEYKQNAAIRRKAKRRTTMTIQDKLKHSQMKPICIDGILYLGVSDAATALGCAPGNITYKLKSDKYPNYCYLTKDEAIQYLQTMSVMKPSEGAVDPK